MKDTPAFPRSIYSLNGAIDSQSMSVGYGMTLRDYFAARAMQGQLSIFENVTALAREQIKLEDVCIASYEVADAMMKARTE
jgi:hypothetical protein